MDLSKKENFNYGIALLKSFMCFIVILCHCWTIEDANFLLPFIWLRPMAVPTFMFVSFYFTQKSFFHKDKEYIKKRIWKLILPQIVWAFIYFIVYLLVEIVTGINLVEGVSDLIWQIFTGHSPELNETMWFQVNLIIISLIFFLVFSYCSERSGLLIISLLSIVCFFLQYSELNYQLFNAMRYELSYPLGRLVETFPMAALGFIASRYNLLEIKKNNKSIKILLVFILAILLLKFGQVEIPDDDFGYAGIWKVAFAFAITMFAHNINFDFLGQKGKHIISFITRYTLGIYCGHRLVGFLGYYALDFLELPAEKFYQCIIIYIVTFIMCWIASTFPYKWIKNVV